MLTNYYDLDKYNSLDVDWIILSIIILIVFFVSLQLIYMTIQEFEKEKNENGK